MRTMMFQHPGARVAFDVLVVIWVLSELRTRIGSRFNPSGRRVERFQASLLLVAVTLPVGVIGADLLSERWTGAAIRSARWVIFVLGLVLFAAGIGVRQWAVTTLGRFFTVDVRLHADQTVIEGGPYRWVRHPSYTGLLLICLGFGLAQVNWAGLALALLLPAVGVLVRIRIEERALLAGLGEPYRRFAAGRPRLVPGLW